jgi:hypothetical protein
MPACRRLLRLAACPAWHRLLRLAAGRDCPQAALAACPGVAACPAWPHGPAWPHARLALTAASGRVMSQQLAEWRSD